jgi:hypothetical protein
MLLANTSILVAAVKWFKYSFIIHLILSLIIIVLTLLGTLHVILDAGIYVDTNNKPHQFAHNLTGFIVTIWLGVEVITGILSRVIQYFYKVNTNVCVWTKRVHLFSSYFIIFIAKCSYLAMYFYKGKYFLFVLLLIIDIKCIALYLWLKFKFWTLS